MSNHKMRFRITTNPYNLGVFDEIDDAVNARNVAQTALREDAEAFIAEYLKTKKRYPTK